MWSLIIKDRDDCNCWTVNLIWVFLNKNVTLNFTRCDGNFQVLNVISYCCSKICNWRVADWTVIYFSHLINDLILHDNVFHCSAKINMMACNHLRAGDIISGYSLIFWRRNDYRDIIKKCTGTASWTHGFLFQWIFVCKFHKIRLPRILLTFFCLYVM